MVNSLVDLQSQIPGAMVGDITSGETAWGGTKPRSSKPTKPVARARL